MQHFEEFSNNVNLAFNDSRKSTQKQLQIQKSIVKVDHKVLKFVDTGMTQKWHGRDADLTSKEKYSFVTLTSGLFFIELLKHQIVL